MWQVEHGRVVVSVTNPNTERTKPRQPRRPEVLGLDRDAVLRDANLCLSIEHVGRANYSSPSIHFEPFNRLIVRLHQRIRHITV